MNPPDLLPDDTHPVLSGLAEVHGLLDRMHVGAIQPLVSGEHASVVAELDRATRRIQALKLKIVAAADQAQVAKDAGFTGADAWLAKTTAEALDAGLVSPDHAAVIVHANGQLPETVSDKQRQTV